MSSLKEIEKSNTVYGRADHVDGSFVGLFT